MNIELNPKCEGTIPSITGIYQLLVFIYGSSKITGEGCADFEEEVIRVTVSIGHALDDLDSAVDTLKYASVQRIATVGQDALKVRFQAADRKKVSARVGQVRPFFAKMVKNGQKQRINRRIWPEKSRIPGI